MTSASASSAGAPSAAGGPAAPAVSLLLIRHGETEWNAAARIQGFRDIALSPRGQQQAQHLAQALAGEPIEAVYTSELGRAIETARPLAQRLGLDLRVDMRLRERGFGIFEGHTYEEAEARWPNEYAIWKRREPGYALPEGGESYLAGRERVFAFLQDIARLHEGSTIAVVTHGGPIRSVMKMLADGRLRTTRNHPPVEVNSVINCAILRLRARRFPTGVRWRMECVNDASHLHEMVPEPVQE